MSDWNNTEIVQQFLDAFNAGDTSTLEEICTAEL
jgi:hypothetical protein